MSRDSELSFTDAKDRTWTLSSVDKSQFREIYAEECSDVGKVMRTDFSKITFEEAFSRIQLRISSLLVRLVSDQLIQRGVSKEDFLDSISDVKHKSAAMDALLKTMERAQR